MPATNDEGVDVELSLNQWIVTNEPVLAEFDFIPEIDNWDWVPGSVYNRVRSGDEPTPWMRKKRKARGFVRPQAWAKYCADRTTPRSEQRDQEKADMAVVATDRAREAALGSGSAFDEGSQNPWTPSEGGESEAPGFDGGHEVVSLG